MTSFNLTSYNAFIETQRERFLAELFASLRIPSVSARKQGQEEAAAFIQHRLEGLGAEVRIFRNAGGAPIVYGTLGNGPRSLLVYDHYDVQPEEPLEEWESPPFEPTMRDGKLFARGVADNKGNLILRLQAIEAWQATQGELPLRLIFLVEGEEEVAPVTLPAFCQEHPDLLRADGCLWETGGRDQSERPIVSCGVKGLQYVELITRGPAYDLHSANATVVPNPAWRLTWALNTLKGLDGRVLIPGFYDDIRPLSEADLGALDTMPDTTDESLQRFGIDAFIGNLRGKDLQQHMLFDPTCNICGLVSGYTGEGSKTILPSEARAKIDFRLVPNMQPSKLLQQLRSHLDAQGFQEIEITDLGGDYPARSPLDAAVVQAAQRAAETTYGLPALLVPTAASTGPMYPLCTVVGTPAVSAAGCGYPGMRIHAPNEHIRLEDYWLGMRWMGQLIAEFA